MCKTIRRSQYCYAPTTILLHILLHTAFITIPSDSILIDKYATYKQVTRVMLWCEILVSNPTSYAKMSTCIFFHSVCKCPHHDVLQPCNSVIIFACMELNLSHHQQIMIWTIVCTLSPHCGNVLLKIMRPHNGANNNSPNKLTGRWVDIIS